MKIETLINLIRGELLNRPFISEVTSFTKNVEDVERGSCFFSNNFEDIKIAIKNGAYAIVSEKEFPIIDKEIAWIKTDSIKKAIFDIFKYENIKTKIYYTDKITAHILKKMNSDKRVVVLEDENTMLKAISRGEKYLISFNSKFKNIFRNIEYIKKADIDLEQVSLFKSKYKNIELNLPLVYKSNFATALNFFKKYNLKYTLEFELDRFKPIFINSKFEKVNYGESDKVLIVGIENDEFFFKELNYLIEKTRYAKTIVIGENNKTDINRYFNFAMIVGIDIPLRKKEERKLFD
jgi:hypothetical protein